MTVEATDFILPVFANLPFLEGFPVAPLAHLRCDRKGHLGVLFGMASAHDAMTGLTGYAGMGEGLGLFVRARGMTDKTGEITARIPPDLLEDFAGISQRMRRILPLGIFILVTITAFSGSCKWFCLGNGSERKQGC